MNTSSTLAAPAASPSAAASSEGASVLPNTDQPLRSAAVPVSIADLSARKAELQAEIAMLERAEQQEAARAAAAELERVTALIASLPALFKVTDLNAVMALLRSHQGRGYAARRAASSPKGTASVKRTRSNAPIPADTRELAIAAIAAGTKEKEFVRRFGISKAWFWQTKAKLRKEGKVAASSKPAKAPKAKAKASPSKGRAKLNARGRVLRVVPPYPAAKKQAIIKRLVSGGSVTEIHKETGVSRASLANWKRDALKAAA